MCGSFQHSAEQTSHPFWHLLHQYMSHFLSCFDHLLDNQQLKEALLQNLWASLRLSCQPASSKGMCIMCGRGRFQKLLTWYCWKLGINFADLKDLDVRGDKCSSHSCQTVENGYKYGGKQGASDLVILRVRNILLSVIYLTNIYLTFAGYSTRFCE